MDALRWLVGIGLSTAMLGGLLSIGIARTGSVRYELRYQTEIRQGIRPTPFTDYWFDEIAPNGSRRTLWHRRAMEMPGKHLISPKGFLWVLTQGFAGPAGTSGVWAATPEGLVNKRDQRFMVNLGYYDSAPKIESKTYGAGGAETLTLTAEDGAVESIIALKRKAGGGYDILRKTTRKGEQPFLLKRALDSGLYSLPFKIETTSHALFATAELKGKKKGIWWLVSHQSIESTPDDLREVYFERQLPSMPEGLHQSPSGLGIWFLFDTSKFPGKATVEVYSHDGVAFAGDLVKAGRYKNAAEAKEKLLIGEVSWWGKYAGWHSLKEKFLNGYAKDGDKFEFYDEDGKRFEITMETKDYKAVSGSMSVHTGFLARRPLYEVPLDAKVLKEEKLTSPNQKFEISARLLDFSEHKWAESNPIYYTLAAKVEEGGKTVRIPLWMKADHTLGARFAVSDSGIVYVLRPQPNVSNTLITYRPTGEQMCGYALRTDDVPFTEGGHPCPVLWEQLSIRSYGPSTVMQIEGVPITIYKYEEVIVPFADGTRAREGFIDFRPAAWTTKNGVRSLQLPPR